LAEEKTSGQQLRRTNLNIYLIIILQSIARNIVYPLASATRIDGGREEHIMNNDLSESGNGGQKTGRGQLRNCP
jgi:hypothetical protein